MKNSAITGKAVLVTGASQGLGAGLAKELARRGARVVISARGAAELETTKARIRADGGEIYAVPSDVGDKQSIYPLLGTATSLIGPIDILINNASTLGPTPLRLLLDTECEDLERVLSVNLFGPFRLTKAVAGSMALRGAGTIVNISSDAAINAYPRWGAYSVSKAALEHLSRVWAAELEAFGVRIFSVDPGEMATRMHADALPDADPCTLADPEDVAILIANILETETIVSGSRVDVSQFTAGNLTPNAEAS